MEIFIFILFLLIPLVVGYLVGSIQNGIIIGKMFFGKDIREYGSHNAGGTNAGRVLGKKVGLIVILLDMFKTFAPMIVIFFVYKYCLIPNKELVVNGTNLYSDIDEYAFSLAALGGCLGHCYPLYYGFKGGKAVSAFAGIMVFTSWVNTIIGVVMFFSILKIKKYVSLSSMLTSLCCVIGSLVMFIFSLNSIYFGLNWGNDNYLIYLIMTASLSLLLIYRHKTNIGRLKRGEESKIKWMK